ncbi:sigma-B regulation protein RsbU (phosphoserine phosphatase) [Arthrobacter sp. B3I9]|uniref:PP2C family protein-serine/threonine phosphatase n=1 Tax=Arthrobacter sp. B3I9 TaxID=3042270 RepID=UPI00279331E7|nr:SpoIIE family protein phosphatase [Arthrobacter sp. B3I9]MDQ0849927.1 sigma-B regulation protein RsbU (phosphoserine phosphatase) [Arthrobacter sp. B3I9]
MKDVSTAEADGERARVRALHSLELMGTAPEERFDRITRIARELFDVPVAAVNLLDEEELFIKSRTGPGSRTMKRSDTFCDVAISSPDLLVVEDAAADPRFASKPDVSGGKGVRFYAGRPLSISGGHLVGTLCLFDTKTRELSLDDRRMLDELGAWAEGELRDSMDLDRAHDVQQALLPASSPGAPSYEVAGLCLPARRVGGDFYTWKESSGTLDLTLADVMGKGTAAALMAATVRAAVHSAGSREPAAAFDQVARDLEHDLNVTGIFATAFQAQLDLQTGELLYADAGHGLTLVVAPDGSYRQLRAKGLPLGLGGPGSWQTGATTLNQGDVLVSFTDGVLDLYDGTLKALDEVAELVSRHPAPSALTSAFRALAQTGEQDDDITVVALRRVA